MLKPILLFLTLCLIGHTALAQIKSYSFYVVEENSKEAIPFLSVYNPKNKTAFQSDEFGLCVIQSSDIKEIFYTYHLSYESVEIDLNQITDTILLRFKAYELYEVDLIELSAEEIMREAVKNIDKNYPKGKNYLVGNYIQIHKENQKYVRYIEAQTSIEKLGYSSKIKFPQEEKFAITNLRKSYNYEKNGDQHGDHLVDLFLENPIQYAEQSILNIDNLSQYQWQFSFNANGIYKLTFQNKVWGSQRNLTGEIEINKDDYAILSITIIEMPNSYAKDEIEGSWLFVNGWYEISFRKNGDKYYEKSSQQWYHHLVKDENNSSSIKYEVEEQFIWESDFTKEHQTSLKYAKMSNLYSKSMPYDSLQWQGNEILNMLRSDLEVKHSLDYQFKNP